MTALAIEAPLAPPRATVAAKAAAAKLATELATADAARIAASALEAFGRRIALVSSFGAESAALLHLVASVDRHVPVIFINTGKHFEQTLAHRDLLASRLGLTDIRDLHPDPDELAREDAKADLWRRANDACCDLRKVRPLARGLECFDAWFTGRKRFHGALRAFLPAVEADGARVKVNPLARWSEAEFATYMKTHDLPPHPLVENGFASIGCWPCTQPIAPGEDPRAGRWRGLAKTECGIHRQPIAAV
jgi:phosphoadenosine phosphosulfate reductase